MNSREIVRRTIRFEDPERVARSTPPEYGCDILGCNADPSVDRRPSGFTRECDEWGAVWENIGISRMGEVKEFPLKEWSDWERLVIPDPDAPHRWTALEARKEELRHSDQYVIGYGVALYERIHFIRGLENTWTDIYLEPENLHRLIDLLVDMNLKSIAHYAGLGVDGYMFCDDWGLQDRLMIDPEKWREFWKPAYRRVYEAAHAAGMQTFLHSCGYIVDILDDLIDCGLDVIQMDQQQNMGLALLSERFRGRITFWCPVDIQTVMQRGTGEIRAYARELFARLATPHGGFIAGYYGDPVGAGHRPEAVRAMCEEFVALRYPACG